MPGWAASPGGPPLLVVAGAGYWSLRRRTRAQDADPAPDPIFYLAGGPGASSIQDAGYALQVLKTAAQDSYWETAVRRGFITDDEILTALASRFHMKIANISLATPQAKVRQGFPNSMTPFPGLKESEIDGLIQFIKSLK